MKPEIQYEQTAAGIMIKKKDAVGRVIEQIYLSPAEAEYIRAQMQGAFPWERTTEFPTKADRANRGE